MHKFEVGFPTTTAYGHGSNRRSFNLQQKNPLFRERDLLSSLILTIRLHFSHQGGATKHHLYSIQDLKEVLR